jgi:hypothetical protein
MRVFVVRPYLTAVMAFLAIAGVGLSGPRYVGDLSAQRGSRAAASFRGLMPEDLAHSFHFARAIYSGGGGWGRGSGWATDWPDADRWITAVLRRLTAVDVFPGEHAVALDDPELRRFPFLYTLEVGRMSLSEPEVQGLRNYLLAGGFLMVDDFHGTYQWRNWEREIRRVLPEYDIVEIPMDHEVFSSFYKIEEIIPVPVVDRGIWGEPSWEQDVHKAYCLGIFDENGRLMVVINWNTDIGDAWEWAEDPRYPLQFSTFAYQIAANLIVHAMTH